MISLGISLVLCTKPFVFDIQALHLQPFGDRTGHSPLSEKLDTDIEHSTTAPAEAGPLTRK